MLTYHRALASVMGAIRHFSGAFNKGALGACLLLASQLAAQPTNRADLLPPSFLPRSPTVQAFQRFDALQVVDMPSGAAKLSVPLAEISSGPLQVSVSLAYSYAGLQVGQPADLVGLGWSLQAGASIRRQVNGIVDDNTIPWQRYNKDSIYAKMGNQRYLKQMYNGVIDSGPDVYSFFLPNGTTGRFVVIDTSVVLLPQQPLTVSRMRQATYGGGFQIATEDGVRYQFQDVEVTKPNPHNFGPIVQHASAWQLTRIISADKADTVRFQYASYGLERLANESTLTTGKYYTGTFEEEGTDADPIPGKACGSTADYSYRNAWMIPSNLKSQYLQAIITRHARILVQRNTARHAHEIKQIRVVSTTNGQQEVRRVDFYQSRFNQFHPTPADTLDYRVRLDSLRESANGVTLPAYRFHYNTSYDMPPRKSAAKDYWGYFNGAFGNGDTNTTTTPTLLADARLKDAGIVPADREPHHQYTQAGALERVEYPTGGTTGWEYEPGRLACDINDIPISKTGAVVGPTDFDPATAQPMPGGQLRVTTSPLVPFDVLEKGDVSVTLSRGRSADNDRLQDFNIWKKRPTGDSLVTTSGLLYRMPNTQTSREFIFQLPVGQYVAQLYCEQNDSSLTLVVASSYRDSSALRLGLPGPGVRVKRTTTAAVGAPPLVRRYEYTRAGGICSGESLLPRLGKEFEQYPLAIVTTAALYPQEGPGPPPTFVPVVATRCHFIATSSATKLLSDQFGKQDYYYSQVKEYAGEEQGMTSNTYTVINAPFNDVVLVESNTYGQLTQRSRYLVQKTAHRYEAVSSYRHFPLLRVRQTVVYNNQLPGDRLWQSPEMFEGALYMVLAALTVPIQTVMSSYDQQGHALTTVTDRVYRQQRQVSQSTSTSTGTQTTHYKRLNDYDGVALPAVAALRQNGFNPVVETQTWRRPATGTDSLLVGGQLTFFDPVTQQPAGAWSLCLAQPAAGPNDERQANGKWANFKSDTRYQQDDSARYDPVTGRVRERRPPHAPPTAYVWGYDRAYMVAQVQNATYAQVLAVLGQATIDQLQGPRPGTDAQVRALLSPLRTRLPQARVITYTYAPLVGETSQTDPSGRTVTYEYDGLGRLVRTRDEQGRILSQQQYHYAGH